VGWPTHHTPPGTEMTSFALRCAQLGVQFSWLDAGVHVPIVPGIAALFRARVRDHAGNLLLMGEDSALEPRAQILLAVLCVSTGGEKPHAPAASRRRFMKALIGVCQLPLYI